MPTYEYRCPNGHRFELFQKMSDEPRASCPDCGLESERLLSGGAGFLFKGEGFYATDYRSDSYKKDASKDASAKTSEGADGAGAGTGKAKAGKGDGGRTEPPRDSTGSSGEAPSEKS